MHGFLLLDESHCNVFIVEGREFLFLKMSNISFLPSVPVIWIV